MAVYWLTFRLEDKVVGGKSYQDRYEALMGYIDIISTRWWLEPTSFIAFESEKGLDEIAAGCKKKIAVQNDMFLIREMNRKSAVICGVVEDKSIFTMMPYLKQLN